MRTGLRLSEEASELGWYAYWRAIAKIFWRVASLTPVLPLSAQCTVPMDTPANWAISLIVIRLSTASPSFSSGTKTFVFLCLNYRTAAARMQPPCALFFLFCAI